MTELEELRTELAQICALLEASGPFDTITRRECIDRRDLLMIRMLELERRELNGEEGRDSPTLAATAALLAVDGEAG